jgi:23S rRNA pseudouridine955/2504/2580 synthase
MLLLSCIVKNIEILFEDDFLIVINKPAGLAVQGGKGVKSSVDKILAEIRTPAPLLVHRLDKDTSGVLAAAKGRETASRFSGFFGGGGKAVKQYIAVCSGIPAKKEGVITLELDVRGSMKNSETRYRVVKSGKMPFIEEGAEPEYSVLEIELGTGRMHQIRRHLAMIGNPVLGDDKYGDFSLNKKLRKAGVKRLLLHAARLTLKDGVQLDVYAPVPQYFKAFT